MTPEGQAAVKRVLNSLDHIAFLTQAGWIPEAMIMPWINPMIVKAWASWRPTWNTKAASEANPTITSTLTNWPNAAVNGVSTTCQIPKSPGLRTHYRSSSSST